MSVRTRFAPSPTGYLHIGGARTALFSWAFARRAGGVCVLRIEDTDLERSTPEATQAILDSLEWLNLNHDEGPYFQSRRMDRYKQVIKQMLAAGHAYYCYCSREELDAMRQAQEAAGLKPRYDGRWRPEPGKVLPPIPAGIQPVVRFKNPLDGEVSWTDMVKGQITVSNAELDDLIIARSDGSPTYNFCVVVDDADMQITHVIRGDDHVANTPRQINIFHALGFNPPSFGHLPLLHGMDGQKLSKRHGAVSVMQYQIDGYLPEAVTNYLSRLGWSHGDEEIFSREQFVCWFSTDQISKSPARFDFEKLKWVNHHYLQQKSVRELKLLLQPYFARQSIPAESLCSIQLEPAIDLLKERCSTLVELASWIGRVALRPALAQEQVQTVCAVQGPLSSLAESLEQAVQTGNSFCDKAQAGQAIKSTLQAHHLKMPQLAIPARVALFGTEQTPSLDAMLTLLPVGELAQRLRQS